MSRRHLQVALVAAVSLGALSFAVVPFAAQPAIGADKVPGESALLKHVAELYASEDYDASSRETILIKIDKVLQDKDSKGEALANPGFWSEAIHQGMFSKSQGEAGKRVKDKEITFELRRGGQGKAQIWFRGADTYNRKNSYPLLFCVVEEGQDPKARVEELTGADGPFKKDWIVVAVAQSKTFPILQDPMVAIPAIANVRRWFNIDSERWFFEGNGTTCEAVQKLASEWIPDRLAGVVLRRPSAPITNSNSAMTSAFVVYEDAGKPVADAWTALDAERNGGAPVAAGAAEGDAAPKTGDQLAAEWLAAHAGRKLPTSYEFVTTITSDDKSGTDWTGSLRVISPGKAGEQTKIAVTYDKAKNVVDIAGENLGEFIVYMNDQLLDLSKPVSIVVNGAEVANRVFERRLRDMFEQVDQIGEFGRLFPAQYRGVVPLTIAPAAADAVEPGGDGDKKEGDGK